MVKSSVQKVFILSFLIALPFMASAQDILIEKDNFPDKKFRDFILSQDFGQNDTISLDEIENIKEMDCSNLDIKDLKGIAFFTALEKLNCSQNKIKNLNVTSNKALNRLICEENILEQLDLGTFYRLIY